MKNKLKEWVKRYRFSEVVSYSLAMIGGYITFKYTNNYYLSGIIVIIGDNLGYYGVIIIKEIKNTLKINEYYNLKLFLKDIRNLSFEFGFPQILEIFVIYPLLIFYIPPLFKDYYIGAFIAMTLAVIIFYLQAIVLYEIRKKYFN